MSLNASQMLFLDCFYRDLLNKIPSKSELEKQSNFLVLSIFVAYLLQMVVPPLESFLSEHFMCKVITLSSCIGKTCHHFSAALQYSCWMVLITVSSFIQEFALCGPSTCILMEVVQSFRVICISVLEKVCHMSHR